MKFRKYLTFEVLVRVAADVVIVNVAYSGALIIRLLWRIAADSGLSAQSQLLQAAQTYAGTFWLLTLVALAVYGGSGFYSRGRFYRGRFKALVIFQAVSIFYVLFIAIIYLAQARGWLLQPPRLALFFGWSITLAITIGSGWEYVVVAIKLNSHKESTGKDEQATARSNP